MQPGLEFDHYLTEKLGGMTVEEMRRRMSMDEYVRWGVYFARIAQREEMARLKAK